MTSTKTAVCLAFLVLLHLEVLGPSSRAVTIAYEAINHRGDQWEYRYHVSGRDFPKDDGFVIYFSTEAELLEDYEPRLHRAGDQRQTDLQHDRHDRFGRHGALLRGSGGANGPQLGHFQNPAGPDISV